MTTLLQQLLASKLVPIGTVGTDGQCGEINGPDDVAVYESMFAAGQFIMQD